MSNKKVLESLEQNIEGVEQLVYFIQYNEELTADELMIDIDIDRYKISGKGSFLDASYCVSSEGTYKGY